jgi:DUF1680 family protein
VNIGRNLSRRKLLQGGALAAAAALAPKQLIALAAVVPLAEFGYGDVTLASGMAESQLIETLAILRGIEDDVLLKPYRAMAGKPAPGRDLGGWYRYDPNYDFRKDDAGLAPGATFGQWVSALARGYAITGSPETRNQVLRLNQLLGEAISADYFEKTRFPAYSYDKLVCGLIDAHHFAADPNAFSLLDRVTEIALPKLPSKAIERDVSWRPGKDVSYTWDESYTLPENLLLASERGAGSRYRDLAARYLMDETFFDPLSRNQNVFAGRHAYSTVNSLSSGMQAWLAMGSEKHLLAVRNAYEMLLAQSFATGGWGPDEQLRSPDSDALYASLGKTHNSFETPCGAYAHFKLTRYLLRVTRDSRYGDSMERVMYNTVLGARPLQGDGRAFYYSDYNFQGKRVYSDHRWPCCSGTLPQIAADYRISAYLRDERGVFVNLYLPSTLKWKVDRKELSLTQEGNYPFDDTIRIKLTMPHETSFPLSLRIPAWAEGASVAINGKHIPGTVAAGTFLTLHRKWKNGDRIALTLPLHPRLEAIDPRHPDTVAALSGPLVLFAAGGSPSAITRKQLLAVRRVEPSEWIAESGNGALRFAPFTALGDAPYSTYLNVTTG